MGSVCVVWTRLWLLACVLGRGAGVPPGPCDARAFGARGDGRSDDTAALNAALARCGHVVLANGTFCSGTVTVGSDRVLEIRVDAALVGMKAKGDRYRKAEGGFFDRRPRNPEWNQERFQDYGHSNFRDCLVLIEDARNVSLVGGGVIDGSNLSKSEPPLLPGSIHERKPEVPTKVVVVKSSEDVRIGGSMHARLRIRRSGWVAILMNNATDVDVGHLVVRATRDGINVVSSRRISISRTRIYGGSDDAIAIKADFALRVILETRDVSIADSTVSSDKCNGLQIGSETVGNISKIRVSNVAVLGAAKAGIGIVSMDGAHVTDVLYENVTMDAVQSLLFMMVGARLRRPGIPNLATVVDAWVGSISDVTIRGLRARRVGHPHAWKGYAYNYSAAHLDGLDATTWPSGSKRAVAAYETEGAHPLGPGIVLADVRADVWGTGTREMRSWIPAHNPKSYVERNVGPSPAYGLFARTVSGLTMEDWHLRFSSNDDRPAFVFDAVDAASLRRSTADRGADSAYDVGLRNGAQVKYVRLKARNEGAFETPKHLRVPRGSNLSLPPYANDS